MEDKRGFEQNDETATHSIDMLLPRYYEANGDQLRYKILRSIPIDGHDVAWMEYTGQDFTGHALHCACDFAEGVGWQIEDDGELESLDGGEDCLQKQTAQAYRQLELKREYIERFSESMIEGMFNDAWDHIPQIVIDLLDKSVAGEFTSERGSHYPSGYLFAETVAKITEMPMEYLWPIIDQMKNDKLIRSEGGLISHWYEVPEPSESE